MFHPPFESDKSKACWQVRDICSHPPYHKKLNLPFKGFCFSEAKQILIGRHFKFCSAVFLQVEVSDRARKN